MTTYGLITPAEEIAWLQDQGYIDGPEVGAEISDEDRRFAFSAEGKYLAICTESTGTFVSDDKVESIRARYAKLVKQSHAIATKLEAGQIRDARECCKYITKPGEMVKLSADELVALQTQLFRMKLAQPMGRLAEEMRARKKRRLRLVKTNTPDGWVYDEVQNWNTHARRTRLEKAADCIAKLAKTTTGACSPRIVCRLPPGFGPSGIKEPRVVVMATRWDEDAVRSHPLVRRLIEKHQDAFDRAWAIKVHVCTSTVGGTKAFDFIQNEPPPRHLLTSAEAQGMAR